MKKEKDIEKIIKQKFEGAEFNIEQAWMDDMSEQLDAFNEKRKKRRFFFWLFFFAGFVGLSIVGYAIFSGDSLEERRNKESHAKVLEIPEEEIDLSSVSTTTRNKEDRELNKRADLDKDVAQRDSENKMTSGLHAGYEKNGQSSGDAGSVKPEGNPNDKENKGEKKDSTDPNVKLLGTANETEKLIGFLKTHDAKNVANNLDVQLASSDKLNAMAEAAAKEEEGGTKSGGNENNPEEEPKWSAGITFGPSFTSQRLKLDNNNGYDAARLNQEKGLMNWNVDLEVSRSFGKLILGSGVSLASIGEKISYEAIETSELGLVDVLVDASYWEYDSTFIQGNWVITDSSWTVNYDTVQQQGMVTAYDSSVIEANGKNRYTYLEIPLQFGVHLLEKDKFELSALLGVSVGFRVGQKGSFLVDGGGITNATGRKISFSSNYGLDMRYRVAPKISIALRPTVKVNHLNHSSIEGVRRKYVSWGVRVGGFINF